MNRRPHDDVIDLPAALSWIRKAWATLPTAPSRLHDRDIEDGSELGAHRFSTAFARLILGSTHDVETFTEEKPCDHADQDPEARRQGELCPRCRIYNEDGEAIAESGRITVQRVQYRSPMAAALSKLAQSPRPSVGTPSPYECVVALAYSAWDVDRAARLVGVPIISDDHRITVQAMFLTNLRRLWHRYTDAPVGYLDKSDSQRSAEQAA